MKKTTIFGLALMVVGLLATTGIVSAYRGDYSIPGPDCEPERHELMGYAFDTLDYDAWYELMTENGRYPRVVDVVKESNFEKFVQAHEAGEKGDYETAATLRTELGLNNGQGLRDGHGKGLGMHKKSDGPRQGRE